MKKLALILFAAFLPLLSIAQPFNNPDGMMRGAAPNTPAKVKVHLTDGTIVGGTLNSIIFNPQGFISKIIVEAIIRKELNNTFLLETHKQTIFKPSEIKKLSILASPNSESLKLETIMTCDNRNELWTWSHFEPINIKDKQVLAYVLFKGNGKQTIYHNPRSPYTDIQLGGSEKKVLTSNKIDTDLPYNEVKLDQFLTKILDPCQENEFQFLKMTQQYEVIKKSGLRNSYYSSYFIQTENGITKFNKKNYQDLWTIIFSDQQRVNSILTDQTDLRDFKKFLKLATLYYH